MNDNYLIPLFVAGTSLLSLFAFFLIAYLVVQKGKQNKYQTRLLQARLQEQDITMDKISREASISIIKNTFAFDPLPALRSYTGPKLIVSPVTDKEEPASLHASFPDIPYKTIAGTSHWIQLDKPDEFNRILYEFLTTVK